MQPGSLAGAAIIVTGGTGFIGSAFVRHAVRAGAQVTVIARAAADHWRLAEVAGRYATLHASLAELEGIALPLGADAFVHFAASGVNQSFDDVRELVRTNVEGTVQALEFALRGKVARFVQLGSSSEYGSGVRLQEDAALNPTSEYGATRAAATLVARAFGQRRELDVVVVRPFAVYGPFEAAYRLMPYCILQGLRGEPINISSGIQTRDYVHVDDVADGIARACWVPAARGSVFNLCSGVETSVLDAATLVSQLTGGAASVAAGAREAIAGEMWRTSGSPDRARAELGWMARHDFSGGIQSTIDWFRDIGRGLKSYR